MNRNLRSALYYGLLGFLAVAYLVPVIWLVSTSLRADANPLRPDQWLPNPITFQHYTKGSPLPASEDRRHEGYWSDAYAHIEDSFQISIELTLASPRV